MGEHEIPQDGALSARAMEGGAGRAMPADVDQADRAVGRPRLDPSAPKGTRSPKLNVAIPEALDVRLKALARTRGVRTSVIVREALDAYIEASSA